MKKLINFIDLKTGCNPLTPKFSAKFFNDVHYDKKTDKKLIKALAQKFNVLPNCVLVENGSAKILQWLYSVSYEKVVLVGDDYYLNDDLLKFYRQNVMTTQKKTEKIIEAIKTCNNKSLIMMTLVSSVDGSLMPINEIIKFSQILNEQSSESILAIDGAYMEYALDNYKALRPLLKCKNIIYIGTFSKAYGLPGLRVGYAISNLFKNKLPYAHLPYVLPNSSVKAACYMLKRPRFLKKTQNYVKQEKKMICHKNKNCINTDSNRIIYIEKNMAEFFFFLIERGFVVRRIIYQAQDAISFSIGTHDQNKLFLKALKHWEKINW